MYVPGMEGKEKEPPTLDELVKALTDQIHRLCEAVYTSVHLAVDDRFIGKEKIDLQRTISSIRNEVAQIGGRLSVMKSAQE